MGQENNMVADYQNLERFIENPKKKIMNTFLFK